MAFSSSSLIFGLVWSKTSRIQMKNQRQSIPQQLASWGSYTVEASSSQGLSWAKGVPQTQGQRGNRVSRQISFCLYLQLFLFFFKLMFKFQLVNIYSLPTTFDLNYLCGLCSFCFIKTDWPVILNEGIKILLKSLFQRNATFWVTYYSFLFFFFLQEGE